MGWPVQCNLARSETSSNVAAYFTAGLKGRWMETRRDDDHVLTDATMDVPVLTDGVLGTRTVPLLTALNLDLRNEYVQDCARGLRKWNAELAEAGLEQRLTLPHDGFNRKVGAFSGIEASPDGEKLGADEWNSRKDAWLPTDVDKTYVRSLMQPVHERGKIAAWIAPPRQGINGKPFDYDYVHLP